MPITRHPKQPLFRIMNSAGTELMRFHSKNLNTARSEARRQVSLLLRHTPDAEFTLERFENEPGWTFAWTLRNAREGEV